MKKHFLVLMALMVSVFAFAGNDVKVDEVKDCSVKEVKAAYTELKTITINRNEISLPFTISVDAPRETVIGVSGPINPNQTWDVQNGKLNIYYTREVDISELRFGGAFHIEVATSPMMYYVIYLNVE